MSLEISLKFAKIKDIKRIIQNKIIDKLGSDYLDNYTLGLMSDDDKTWLLDIKTKQATIIADLNLLTTKTEIDNRKTFDEISKYKTILGG